MILVKRRLIYFNVYYIFSCKRKYVVDNDFFSLTDHSDKLSKTVSKKYYKQKSFICDICGSKLSSKQKIVEHLQRHVKYICEICSERFELLTWRCVNNDNNSKWIISFFRCHNRKALETHYKAEHSQGNILICVWNVLIWSENVLICFKNVSILVKIYHHFQTLPKNLGSN